ncbi:MAG: tetratricopeptide repeat protein [Chloroflexi bacterium]|nr:tetratricopeptide repeat protein [Chloroflexota bacterium]
MRALAEPSISAALDSDWQKAADLNKQILEGTPDDVEARNRYGRALLELGKLEEARAAYQETLKSYPHDPIALRQVSRIGLLLEDKHKADTTRSKTQTRLFIEDMGKTGILRLMNPAPANVLARYSPGAEATLREQQGLLAVHARDGMLLGFLDPKVGRRLLELINAGNEYVVAIVTNLPNDARVAIRETLQSAENAHRISFPGHHRPVETKERAYIKGTFFRYGEEAEGDEEEEAGDEEEVTPAIAAVAADEDLTEERLPVEADDDDEDEEPD